MRLSPSRPARAGALAPQPARRPLPAARRRRAPLPPRAQAPEAPPAADQGAADAKSASEPATSTSSTATDLELAYEPLTPFASKLASLRLALFALPWRRVKPASALVLKLGGALPEQPQGRFSPTPSLPGVCDCLLKAAYDPRICGLVVKIDPLSMGWAKVAELRRHVALFRASGKWALCYMERGGEKEYALASAFGELFAPPTAGLGLRGFAVSGTFLRGVLDKIGVEPEVRRIGAYKSAGDQLLRKHMAAEQRESLNALLDDVYGGFVADAAAARGKTEDALRAFVDEGAYEMERFVEGGWLDGLMYEDELDELVRSRTGGKADELRAVGYRRYAKVGRGALGLAGGGKTRIAVLRASGAIVAGSGSPGGGVITAGAVVAQLRALRKDKSVAAVVLRVDSGGGDALASDLMWREIRRLDETKPVVASMGDAAASGGYYMAMAARRVVAESLTLTGSVGVVAGKFSLGALYEKVGYAKESLSRGRYARLLDDSRPMTADEGALFDASALHAYESFRDKAAASRGMAVEAMEAVAQGRVWSGRRALENGLVDEIGGVAKAVAIAAKLAGLEEGVRPRVSEVSRAPFSPLALVAGGGGAAAALGAAAAAALGGGGGAAALGAPALLAALLAAACGGGAADAGLLEGLAAGRAVAAAPGLGVDGAASAALGAGAGAAAAPSGSELFDL